MKMWEVDVHLGSGGDTDSIGTYLVYAEDAADAEAVALGESRYLINATVRARTDEEPIDEMDYDGVLMSDKARGSRVFDSQRGGSCADAQAAEAERGESA